MSDTPTPEEQAEMAVILSDKVKDLVRTHLKEALEDFGFLYGLDQYPVVNMITSHHEFKVALKKLMREMLDNTY